MVLNEYFSHASQFGTLELRHRVTGRGDFLAATLGGASTNETSSTGLPAGWLAPAVGVSTTAGAADAPPGVEEYAVEGLSGSIYYFWSMLPAVLRTARLVVVHNPRVAAELREGTPGLRVDTIRMGVPASHTREALTSDGRETVRRGLHIRDAATTLQGLAGGHHPSWPRAVCRLTFSQLAGGGVSGVAEPERLAASSVACAWALADS
jgi:hypothetical protein